MSKNIKLLWYNVEQHGIAIVHAPKHGIMVKCPNGYMPKTLLSNHTKNIRVLHSDPKHCGLHMIQTLYYYG